MDYIRLALNDGHPLRVASCLRTARKRRCKALGRQLLGVTCNGFDYLGSGLTIARVDNYDRVTSLVIARAWSVRFLLPVGAQRVAFDFPLAVPRNAHRGLVKGCAIRAPIDYSLTRLPVKESGVVS